MNIEWIREWQKFKSKTELDQHVRIFLHKRKAVLSEGTLKVLTFIWRHAVKFPGVAFPKKQTIITGTSLSDSTVARAIRCLVKEGLIEKVSTKKPNGRQGVNLLIFLPQANLFLLGNDTPQSSANPHQDNSQPTKSVSETKNKQHISSFSNVVPFDHSFLPSFIPSSFIETSKPFLSVEQVLAAWRTAESAYKQVQLNMPVEEYLPVIIQTFKQAVFAYKMDASAQNCCVIFMEGW